MTLPARVRVNVIASFPTHVDGVGFIEVTKANGVWSISPNYTLLETLPAILDPTLQELVVYDTVTGVFSTVTVDVLLSTILRTRPYSTHADLVAAIPVTGAIARTLGYYAESDGGGRDWTWHTGDYSTQVALDTDGGMFVKAASVSATVGAWVGEGAGDLYHSMWFGGLKDGTDNSARITRALAIIASLPSHYANPPYPVNTAILRIAQGTRFNRILLTLPQDGYLEFYPQDDTRGAPYAPRATSEMITLAFNATSGSGGGIVNEKRFEAAYAPGFIINTLKDMPGHDAYLAPGYGVPGPRTAARIPDQVRSSKGFLVFEDEYFTSFQFTQETFGGPSLSQYSGMSMAANIRRLVLNVDDSSHLSGAAGSLILGLISGAFGYFVSSTLTTVTIDWAYSQFIIGESLYDGAGGPYPVLGSFGAPISTPGQAIYFHQSTGGIGFGIAAGYNITDFAFAGRVTFTTTVDLLQHKVETVTHAAAVFLNGPIAAPSVGKQIVLDGSNRLVTVNGTAQSTAASGAVEANGAWHRFNNAGGVSAGAFNVASVARVGLGQYLVTLIVSMLNTGYVVTATSDNEIDHPICTSQGLSTFIISNFNHLTNAPADLIGIAGVTLTGGK